MRKILALTAASGLALTGIVTLAPSASAKDGDVKMRQACSGGSSFSVVKVKGRDGGLRTDFYVKNNKVGQAWVFTLAQGSSANVVASTTRSTRATNDVSSSADDDTRHTAEVKFRNYLSDGSGPLIFTATSGAEKCLVTVNL
jgi:hypothetical protein